MKISLLPWLLVCLSLPSFAQESPVPEDLTPEKLEQLMKAMQAEMKAKVDAFRYQTGEVKLKGGRGVLALPQGYRFIGPKDAKTLLEDLWQNPPGSGDGIEGMVVPRGQDLSAPSCWAIVVDFEEDGYVSDADADEINYNDLLKQMKESSAEASEEREKAGFGKFLLTGWALPPRYDKASHVMYWAQRFDTGSDEDSLNYDVRVLGRRGVLSLNAVASASQAAEIDAQTPEIVSLVKFNSGHRYEDFDPLTDKKAEYTLAGLVLGGAVAAKLLGKVGLLAVVAKFGKILILPVLAIGGWLKKRFSRSEG